MLKGWIRGQVSDILDAVKKEAKQKYETVREEARQKYDTAMEELDAKIHGVAELIECYKMSISMEMQEEFKKIQDMQAKILKEFEDFKSKFGKL